MGNTSGEYLRNTDLHNSPYIFIADYVEQGHRGARSLFVLNPGGISAELQLDKAMDVFWAEAFGFGLTWISPRGRVPGNPMARSIDWWTDNFSGGLLSTLGLENTGATNLDGRRKLPLHGTVGCLPAEDVSWNTTPDAIVVKGEVRDFGLGSHNIVLRRRFEFSQKYPEMKVTDFILNEGSKVRDVMFRHHYNLGGPLVKTGTGVFANLKYRGERKDLASAPRHFPYYFPTSESEWVGYYEPLEAGLVQVGETIDSYGFQIEFSTDSFPYLLLWRQPDKGHNILGVEPSMSFDRGYVQERAQNNVATLAAGESIKYESRICVTKGLFGC